MTNRQQRRAARRDVRAALREAGCSCAPPWPMLHPAATPLTLPGVRVAEHGEVTHDSGCVLGERIICLQLEGYGWDTIVQVPAACAKGRS